MVHLLMDFAMWSGVVEVARNPIDLVVVKGATRRTRQPRNLTLEEFQKLSGHLKEPFGTMALVCICFGLRISECLALRWSDVDWLDCKLLIERGIVEQNVDKVKTDSSRKSLTIAKELLDALQVWRRATEFASEKDRIFASPLKIGKLPYSYTGFWRELQRAAIAAGIGEMGTHTFPHTSLLERRLVGSHAAPGDQLLTRFCQDDRIQIHQPRRNLQIKFTRPIAGKNDFVAYVDAIGKLDGRRCLLEWKTSSSRYPEEPEGLLSLDPQLVCYSWMTGISDVAQVVFVRKRLVEVQYLRTTITDEQRQEFGHLVESTVRRIEAADFLPHSGIRFPQNPCSSCPYVGLCLGNQQMADASLVRRPGADSLDWLDELNY
ncbi:MAG: tyrosine-type recombinase/integrase [Candidatus Sulfotelmatobacter sp.]